MKSKYEIELRGLLKPKQRENLVKLLTKKGKLVKKYSRIHWCFGLSLKKELDLRIRQTDGDSELSLKVGNLGKTNRKEISLPIPKDKIKQAFEFLKHLGYYEGVKAIRNAKVYEYDNIEWAIVEVPGHSYYFEAEKLVKNKRDGKAAEEEIRRICRKLNLSVYTPKQTIDYIKKLDREANKPFKL